MTEKRTRHLEQSDAVFPAEGGDQCVVDVQGVVVDIADRW